MHLNLNVICMLSAALLLIASGVSAAEKPTERGLDRLGGGKAPEKTQAESPQVIKKDFSEDKQEGAFRALVIGNNDYYDPNGKWNALKTAKNDARSVYQVLKKRFRFKDIQLLQDATRQQIILALDELGKRTAKGDSVLVYYAGHGHLEKEEDQSEFSEGYWIPVDAVGGDISTYVANSTIRNKLLKISSKSLHTLLISDSCFSGSLLQKATRSMAANRDASYRYYEKVASQKSVQVFAAGGFQYVDDYYGSSGHSPFTYFLLRNLSDTQRDVFSLSDISLQVTKAVATNALQTPVVGAIRMSGHELGEFVFVDEKSPFRPFEAASNKELVIEPWTKESFASDAWITAPRF